LSVRRAATDTPEPLVVTAVGACAEEVTAVSQQTTFTYVGTTE
jgi:Ni,Fe-hydrogenase III small subunit